MAAKALFLVSLLLAFVCVECTVLYGVTLGKSGDGTESVVQIVEVNITTGNVTLIENSFYYYDQRGIALGISAFDQQNMRFLYVTNYREDFIYSVDVNKSLILPPLSIGSAEIHSLRYDTVGAQLLVEAIYPDRSSVFLTVPYLPTLPIKTLLNLTELGIGPVFVTAIDQIKGYFFFIHLKSDQYSLSYFPLTSPSSIQTVPFACNLNPKKEFPTHLFFDFNANKVLGTFNNESVDLYFEVPFGGDTCTIKSTGIDGAIYTATYDFATSTLYLSYLTSKGPELVLYNTQNYTSSSFKMDDILLDIQVSYFTWDRR